MSKLILSLALLGAYLNLAAADTPPTADGLISAAKQATGGEAWDKIVTWHEKEKVTAGGLVGKAESWIDLTNLHNTGTFALGPATGGEGWDGTHLWTTNSSGDVRIEGSQEALAGAMQDAYRGAWAMYFPDRFPATREYVGQRTAEGKSFDAVKITPKDADPFEVWFDPKTHRVDRAIQITGAEPHTFFALNYAPEGGVITPHKVIDRTLTDPKFDLVTEVMSVVQGGPEDPSRYAPPPPPPDTAQWPAGQDSVTLPFKLRNNHIYVEALLNGHATVTLIFDTGATNVIQNDTAKAAGITVEGALPSGGFGNKIEASGLAKVKSISLGGFALVDQVFTTEGSAGWVAVEGAKSDGLVGYEFVKKAVLSIDYEKSTMTFTKPSKFQPPSGVEPISFTFDQHIPMIPAELDGVPGEFELDTGSRGALTVMMPFAQAHGLIDKYHATVSGTMGYGVGGPVKALLGRAGKLTIGPATIDGPIIEVVTTKGGAGSELHVAGNMGGDLLKRFTVTLDYAHQLLWLQPNARAAQREVFDRSGLWIARAADGGIAIADVTSASAAAKAGLVVGDEITSINGKPARDFELYDLRESFKGDPGTKFDLGIKGKSGAKNVTLILVDQV